MRVQMTGGKILTISRQEFAEVCEYLIDSHCLHHNAEAFIRELDFYLFTSEDQTDE